MIKESSSTRDLSKAIKRKPILSTIILSTAGILLAPASDTLSVCIAAETSQTALQTNTPAPISHTDAAMDIYWLQKAAEEGDAEAQFMLALCYRNGTGITQDNTQAIY